MNTIWIANPDLIKSNQDRNRGIDESIHLKCICVKYNCNTKQLYPCQNNYNKKSWFKCRSKSSLSHWHLTMEPFELFTGKAYNGWICWQKLLLLLQVWQKTVERLFCGVTSVSVRSLWCRFVFSAVLFWPFVFCCHDATLFISSSLTLPLLWISLHSSDNDFIK